jgi:hypothetical protein
MPQPALHCRITHSAMQRRLHCRMQVNEQGEVNLWLWQLLEHQLMKCLSCWGKFDPYLLSSWCNRNLRSFNHPDTVLGAGHFYEERVYQKIIFPPSPFQINDLYQLFME